MSSISIINYGKILVICMIIKPIGKSYCSFRTEVFLWPDLPSESLQIIKHRQMFHDTLSHVLKAEIKNVYDVCVCVCVCVMHSLRSDLTRDRETAGLTIRRESSLLHL